MKGSPSCLASPSLGRWLAVRRVGGVTGLAENCHTIKTGRAFRHDLIYHLFLLLPRMVASGLAACFMKAEGLMPTMFLNCLEKW